MVRRDGLDADVLVVGAGTAGAAAAASCARRGLRVTVVERRPLDEAGARWVNGVPAWAFDEAGIDRPEAPERVAGGQRFHMLAGWGPRRVVVRDHGVLDVDMRALVARLQGAARDAGATLHGDTAVHGWSGDRVETDRGALRARWVVDASGLGGAGLMPAPEVPREDLCAAAQEVREVADADGARAFFRRHEVEPGDTLCFTGVAGGYSIVNVRLEGDHVSILTGSVPALGHPSGRALLDDFVAREAWVGPRVYGGSRAIPLRRPADRLVHGRVALLGDAGCQVFTAHGSGIGAGMIAGRMLADALADGDGLRGYAVRWMRRWGGLLASYDAFRRYSQRLESRDVERLMASGLLDAETSRFALAQEPLPIGPRLLASRARAAMREPGAIVRMGPVLARMAALRAVYDRYPEDPAKVERWSALARRISGDG